MHIADGRQGLNEDAPSRTHRSGSAWWTRGLLLLLPPLVAGQAALAAERGT